MSKSFVKQLLLGSAVVLMIASCGGGGDIAGQSATYGVSPGDGKLDIFGLFEGDCSGAAGDTGVTVTIVGGVAPYRIHNSDPGGIAVDKTEASGKDPTFNVRATGQICGIFVVSVLDYHSNLAIFKYTVAGKKVESTQ